MSAVQEFQDRVIRKKVQLRNEILWGIAALQYTLEFVEGERFTIDDILIIETSLDDAQVAVYNAWAVVQGEQAWRKVVHHG